MTYAFAARPAGTLFCPNFSAFASFELRARSRQALCVSTFWLKPFACPEKSSQRAKILMDCSAEKKVRPRWPVSLRPQRPLRFSFSWLSDSPRPRVAIGTIHAWQFFVSFVA
jgi:hypothetical protein